jgi:hypothetical protein
LLRIEDLLPLFPITTDLDEFKNEVLQAVGDYDSSIARVKAEMDEATRSAESVREELKTLKQRYAFFSYGIGTMISAGILTNFASLTTHYFPTANHDCLHFRSVCYVCNL